MYSNISQILLLYKTWWYYNKFDSTKSLGVCYLRVKIPQCRYMEHGSKHITFYVQKHIAALAMCYDPAPAFDKSLGVPASVKLVCCWYNSIGDPIGCVHDWHASIGDPIGCVHDWQLQGLPVSSIVLHEEGWKLSGQCVVKTCLSFLWKIWSMMY